jgi:delta-aminolevulinic acid dehydratase/porphobilinogen synthase
LAKTTGLRIFKIDFMLDKIDSSVIFRAGADVIISYFTPDVLAWLNEGSP